MMRFNPTWTKINTSINLFFNKTHNSMTTPPTQHLHFLLLLPFWSEAHSDAKTGNLKAAVASVSQQIMTVTSKQKKNVVESGVPSKHQGLLTPWPFVLFTLPLKGQNYMFLVHVSRTWKKRPCFYQHQEFLLKFHEAQSSHVLRGMKILL